MQGLKSFFAIAAIFSLLLAVIGLVRFGFDLWNHLHSPTAASIALDYRGLWIALFFVVMCGLFLGAVILLEKLKL